MELLFIFLGTYIGAVVLNQWIAKREKMTQNLFWAIYAPFFNVAFSLMCGLLWLIALVKRWRA
jgi:hypothetical protein